MLLSWLLQLVAPLPLAILAASCQDDGLDLCSYPRHGDMLNQLHQLAREHPRWVA